MMMVVITATITCPECGAHSREQMPTNACQFSYTCPYCLGRLRALPGECCVFCSYADELCTPKQTCDPAEPLALEADAS